MTTHPQMLSFRDGSSPLEAEAGRIKVPENRKNPAAREIEISFLHIKALTDDPGPSVFWLQGGPGVPAIEPMRADPGVAMTFLELSDLIVFDQRGVGLSRPCLDSPVRLGLPLDHDIDREELLDHYRVVSRKVASWWREQGVDLAGYNTEESADDVDALRAAMDLDEIVLHGASYGSHLGICMLRRHPEHVAKAILGLVEGPDHTFKLPSNVQRSVEMWDDLWKRQSGARAASLIDLIGELLDRLERSPVAVDVQHPVTKQTESITVGKLDLQQLLCRAVGRAAPLARVPNALMKIKAGDYSELAETSIEFRTSHMYSAMTHLMDCASGASAERMERIGAEAPGSFLEEMIDYPMQYIAEAWGAPDLGPEYRAPVVADVPTLLVSGTLDGRTPPSNALEVAEGLKDSRHIIVENLGHAHYAPVPGVSQAIQEFLRTGETALRSAETEFRFDPID